MANWSEKRDPIPDKKETGRFKVFLEQKYLQKKWSVEAAISDSDSDSDKKKKKKDKKKKKQKKVESSDESDEIVVPQKKEEIKKGTRKLGAPPGFKPVSVPAAQTSAVEPMA